LRFALTDIRIAKANEVSSDHVRLFLPGNLKAIAFRCVGQPLGEALLKAPAGQPLHLAGKLKLDSWQGAERAQLIVEDAPFLRHRKQASFVPKAASNDVSRSVRAAMIQISIPWIVEVLAAIDRVTRLDPNSDPFSNWVDLSKTKSSLDALYLNSVYIPHLRVSAQKAEELRKTIETTAQKHIDFTSKVTDQEIAQIRYLSSTLIEILKSELAIVPSFLVHPKGSHDLTILTKNGDQLFPEKTSAKAPETMTDMRETGKALAFELPTACGFHTFRVLEAVVKIYWDHITNGMERPRLQTLGAFSEELKDGVPLRGVTGGIARRAFRRWPG